PVCLTRDHLYRPHPTVISMPPLPFHPSLFFFFSSLPHPLDLHSSLHDALPICSNPSRPRRPASPRQLRPPLPRHGPARPAPSRQDRKSTRLNSSHVSISYAVFCLKKKKPPITTSPTT